MFYETRVHNTMYILLYFSWADQRRRLFRIDHTVQRAHMLTLILITARPRARARAGAKQKEGKIQ